VLELVSGTEEHIQFIMSTERLPGYENVVGRWDEQLHRESLTDRRFAYFVARRESELVGFAILRDWKSPDQVTLLKRIAVANPGNGAGKAMLQALMDVVFTQTNTYRFWLGVFPENERARFAYEKVGFVAEGITRGSAFLQGQHKDELIMSVLRPEWEMRRNSR
jgi:RimJ/RimL family protein N-acetyltransferase